MTSWRDAVATLRQRGGRSLLSLLSVVIAVAAIVAVTSATATTRKAYRQVFEALSGRADLEVVARGGGRFQQGVADKLRDLPHVRAVVPVFHRATIVYAHGIKAKVLAVGIVKDEPESIFGFKLVEGHFPSKAGEIALEANLAEGLHLKVGDELRLLTARGLRPHKLAGITKLENAARLHEGGMLLAPVDRLQTVFKSPGEVDALNVYLDDKADPAAVIREAGAHLPVELRMGTPESRSGLAEETLLLTEVSLNLASALSFTTAVFIVLSVFLMSVSERRRQLAILRAVGATRSQVVGIVCREAFVLGCAGTLLGIPLGVYGGGLLIHSTAAILQVKLPETPDLGLALLAGGILGPAICLVAAWYPARKASRVSPLEGMRAVVATQGKKSHRVSMISGIVGMAITSVVALFCVQGVMPIAVSIPAVILSLVSLVLMLPGVLPWAMRFIAWPLGHRLPIALEMSKRLVLRHDSRSALTIGVLFIAVAASVGTSNAVFSINEDISTWYERTITADFLIRTTMPDMSGQDATSINESFSDRIHALDGVQQVEGVRLLRVQAKDLDAMVVARDFSLYHKVPLDIIGGNEGKILQDLAEGEAVVGSVLAERLKVRPGDSLPVIYGDHSHTFRVAGIATEYSFGGSVVYIDRNVAKKLFEIDGIDSFLIKVQPDKVATVGAQLKELAGEEGLLMQSFSELSRLIDSMVAGVTVGLWILLALGLLVGALGVVNTLTMNVLEQTRELGMLRSIGMQRRQVILTVLGQAGFIGVLGIFGGAVAGLSLARTINLCLGSMFGRYVPFAVRFPFVATLLGVALLIVLVAALIPARRAAGLNPIQAIRQE